MIEEIDDEYESGSEESQNGYLAGYDSPIRRTSPTVSTHRPTSTSPSRSFLDGPTQQSSGLRLLLSNAPKSTNDQSADVEQKDDAEYTNRGLKRVERHDSLQTVLKDEQHETMFASAPVAAMKDPELPKGLLFGFLDDSAVSRAAFMNSLQSNLFGSEYSFIRGSTIEEACEFPDEVVTKKPDIVVLDHCLDYEVSPGVFQSFKGTDLARDMRQKGFEGCIIIQSDQESLRNLVDFNIVDGITGRKTGTSSFAIARMVAMARRKHKAPTIGGLTLPSSTTSSWNSRAESSFSFEVEDGNLHKRLTDE
jgi:hypothetical protein